MSLPGRLPAGRYVLDLSGELPGNRIDRAVAFTVLPAPSEPTRKARGPSLPPHESDGKVLPASQETTVGPAGGPGRE